ncbi:MAG: dihydrodipicolinate synthase family protein [Gammaproteobacteria bacterium]|nr:dihydrodipicolinate synthase family protein [Gammaproteobacteria bacterium]MDH3508395.1 dihydrodipicolinate synthase family protein [Gammaproteobacteria bacterium]
MTAKTFSGVLVPALTPFDSHLDPDTDALLTHCRWLLDQGADGLAVFGTTSEANSLSLEERMSLLEHLLENGIPADKLMPGTGMCALSETVRLTRHAVEHGCRGVLMLPPFYYKAINDDGLFASYAEVIERVGNAALGVYLYHIPPVAQVGLSLGLIGRLLSAYPDTVVGLKDSSGDWENTSAVLREYPSLATFCGSEVFLLETMRNGGAGSITATGNINAAQIRKLYCDWQKEDAEALQAQITTTRRTYETYATIPALKAVAADFYATPDWRVVRPPLLSLGAGEQQTLVAALADVGFEMGA